jgi:hypothetical protein
MVEADEVIHMPVADEYVSDAQEFPGRKHRNVAEIEQQSPALKNEIDVEAGIPEGSVDELRVEVSGHIAFSSAIDLDDGGLPAERTAKPQY